MSNVAIIEPDTRISKSVLWEIQSRFYKKHGIEFWRQRASFTSANTVVVSACVDLMISYLKDQGKHLDPKQPIYFVELGTGSGCFAYRFLKEFFSRLSSAPEISHLNVRYVMTDFIPEIVSIWQSNPFLKPFIDSESLDFAVFDPVCDQVIATSCFGWSVNSQVLINAPIFIANALFDTIGVDGFRFSKLGTSEILISTEANSNDPMSSLVSNTLAIHQSDGAVVQTPYYDNQHFDTVLNDYSSVLQNGVLSIPIKALEILENLRNLTQSRMALLCCSRGFTDLHYAELSEQLQYHDLSFPLNFDALRKFFAITGGELFLPKNQSDVFVSRCIAFGYYLPESQKADSEHVQEQYPISADKLVHVAETIQKKMSQSVNDSGGKSTIDAIIDIVTTGQYDPPLFLKCLAQSMDSIESELPHASQSDLARLIDLLYKVDSNIYTFDREIPESLGGDDVLGLLIRVWQRASAAHHQPTGRTLFSIEE
ncbi:hypothetical protein BH10CYA1_BH10CYA1_58910 [soil metagenome]